MTIEATETRSRRKFPSFRKITESTTRIVDPSKLPSKKARVYLGPDENNIHKTAIVLSEDEAALLETDELGTPVGFRSYIKEEINTDTFQSLDGTTKLSWRETREGEPKSFHYRPQYIKETTYSDGSRTIDF